MADPDQNGMTYEYIVVGTGPGGGTVARELARAEKSVLMIEAGAWHEHGLGFPFGLRLLKGLVLFSRSREGVIVGRGITVGGSSMVYNGNVFDPPAFLYEKMGLDFSREAAELKKEIGVSTLPDKFFTNARGGNRVREAADKMGISFRLQEKFIDPQKCQVGCDWCMLGCPRNAKWSSRAYVKEAIDHGAAILTSSPVDRVLFERGGRAVGVKLKNRTIVRGEKVILAAGGIGSAEILLRSGMKEVGQTFFMDPMNVVIGYAESDDLGGWREMTFTHATEDFEHTDGFLIGNVGASYALFSNFARLNMFQQNAARMIPSVKRGIGLFVKLADNANGEIFPDGKFSKPFDEDDRKRMKKGTEVSREILQKAGIDPATIGVAEAIGGHPGGSAAMGKIVDTNFMTEHENLYVCDASVLPVSPGAPPSLAILAFSRLLGKMLLGKVTAAERKPRSASRGAEPLTSAAGG